MPEKEAVAAETQILRLDSYLPYRLSVASNAVSRLIARAYEDRFGLTIPQWRLMAVLAEAGPLTQQAIGQRTMMDKVTVSRATQGLVKRKLVQRAPHDADGRSHHVMLSKAGARLYDEISPVALEYEARLLRHFDPAAVESLKQFLLHLERAAAELAGSGAAGDLERAAADPSAR
ncbi:MAG TPA: MarR family transcriptional regulator [Steroidobacteraceae bacterium]